MIKKTIAGWIFFEEIPKSKPSLKWGTDEISSVFRNDQTTKSHGYFQFFYQRMYISYYLYYEANSFYIILSSNFWIILHMGDHPDNLVSFSEGKKFIKAFIVTEPNNIFMIFDKLNNADEWGIFNYRKNIESIYITRRDILAFRKEK